MDSESVNIFDLVMVNFGASVIDARPYQFDDLSTKVLAYHTTCPGCNQRVDIPVTKIKLDNNIKYVFCETCNLGLDKWNSIDFKEQFIKVECEQECDDIILLDDMDFDAVTDKLSDIENKYTRFINE